MKYRYELEYECETRRRFVDIEAEGLESAKRLSRREYLGIPVARWERRGAVVVGLDTRGRELARLTQRFS